MTTFDDLIAEAVSVPVDGWDFSWFEGRASEERPAWGYAATVAGRIGAARAVLDAQTGGGEVFGWVLRHADQIPATLAATESWPPNLQIARGRLAPCGVRVVGAADRTLPFAAGTFDLVTSRHPVVTDWAEVARVLVPGGSYLSQQVGAGSNHELIEFLMGRQPVSQARSPRLAVGRAEAAGLKVVDLREARLRVVFHDVGAVVHFLRKVVWTVPDFTVGRYREPLLALHEQIRRDGPFVAHSYRFLIEARRQS